MNARNSSILRRLALRALCGALAISVACMYPSRPVAAEVTSDEAGQLDIWATPAPLNAAGGAVMPLEPEPQPVSCNFQNTPSLVRGIDALLMCEQPQLYGRDHSGQTYCNVYATHVMDAIFPADMADLRAALGPNHPSVMADNFYEYFAGHWAVISPQLPVDQRLTAAQRYADAGYLVVASEPGHIGFIEASTGPHDPTDTDTVMVAQGGATAGHDIPLSQAWTQSAIKSQVMFFYKQPGAAAGTPVMTLAQILATMPPETHVATTAENTAATPGGAATAAPRVRAGAGEGDL